MGEPFWTVDHDTYGGPRFEEVLEGWPSKLAGSPTKHSYSWTAVGHLENRASETVAAAVVVGVPIGGHRIEVGSWNYGVDADSCTGDAVVDDG